MIDARDEPVQRHTCCASVYNACCTFLYTKPASSGGRYTGFVAQMHGKLAEHMRLLELKKTASLAVGCCVVQSG
jgi:hypothetical protein